MMGKTSDELEDFLNAEFWVDKFSKRSSRNPPTPFDNFINNRTFAIFR